MKFNIFYIIIVFFLSIQTAVVSQQKEITVFDLARTGDLKEMKNLLKSDPELIDAKNDQGYSPLILACYNGNTAVAKYIIDNCKNINLNNGYGTALMAATIKGNEVLISYLLEKKADVNITDANSTTALHYAIIFNLDTIAKSLIKSGAKYDIKDNRGNTAKDYAIIKNKTELLTLLIP